jgi:HEAT repeat protein
MSRLALLVTTPAKQPWFWQTALVLLGVLLLANLVLAALVYGRRLRELVRGRRAKGFRARFEPVVEQAAAGRLLGDPEALRRQIGDLDELERPVAASMLLERLRPSSPEERAAMLEIVRELGGIELLLTGTKRRRPWRRALSIRTLGWLGASEGVSPALAHLTDANRYVRDASVRALGRIRDESSLPVLEELYLDPDHTVASGFVYEAVTAFGPAAEGAFTRGLRSPDQDIRVSSCFGVAAVLEPGRARPLLEGMLADRIPAVRAAAAESLGRIGGERLPEALAEAGADEDAIVRRAAAAALGAYDDPRTLAVLRTALDDPDRLTASRAGESIVRLGATTEHAAWPIERARTLKALGAL